MNKKLNKEIDIKKLHEGSWEKITSYLDTDLPLPYLSEEKTFAAAVKEMYKSVGLEQTVGLEIPIPQALIGCYSEKIHVPRKPDICILHGGLSVPYRCVEDYSEEELFVGITHENTRNSLRCSALIYGIVLPPESPHYFSYFDALDDFEDLVSAMMAREILLEDIQPELFSKIIIRYRREKLRRVSPFLLQLGKTLEEEADEFSQKLDRLREGTIGYDMIHDAPEVLYSLLDPSSREDMITFYEGLKQRFLPKLCIKRRVSDSEWEEIKPIP